MKSEIKQESSVDLLNLGDQPTSNAGIETDVSLLDIGNGDDSKVGSSVGGRSTKEPSNFDLLSCRPPLIDTTDSSRMEAGNLSFQDGFDPFGSNIRSPCSELPSHAEAVPKIKEPKINLTHGTVHSQDDLFDPFASSGKSRNAGMQVEC